jgi:Uma2 family endonuclease
MTAEEFIEICDDQPSELVKGEFIAMSPAGGRHGKFTLRVGRIVGDFVDEHDLGEVFGAETGFILFRDPDTVRAPDFAFIAKERLHLIADVFDEFLPIAPDLVVEIVSPYDHWTEIEAKVNDYLRAGVRLVWVMNPSTKTIHVYHGFTQVQVLTLNDILDGADVLPEFSISVARIFA